MNRFEKNILENEMGLDRLTAIRKDGDTEESVDDSTAANEEVEAEVTAPQTTDGGEQLKIDDMFLGSDNNDSFFLYGYQDELNLTSLKEESDKELESNDKDGTRLYVETVALLESGEIELEDGIALLKKNANNGHALSSVYLGQLYSDPELPIYNPTFALDCYVSAAKLDFGEGHYNLGLCYYRGFGCDVDHVAAADCFAKGAESFNANCICALGMCYEYGIGSDVNYEYAFNLYEKAAELGHAMAANNLGGCYFYGHGVEMDRQKAIEIYTRAISLGSSDAECRLGIILEEGEEVVRDAQAAVTHYKHAAKLQNPIALYRLGLCYMNGTALEQSYNQAYKCFVKAAALGYDPAKCEAGKLCAHGTGIKRNPDHAYKFFFSAADNGYIPAFYEVANCLFEGIGTMKDRVNAYKYFLKAYELDDIHRGEAAYKIGICHLKSAEHQKAFDWFVTGAELGCAAAHYMLGECYYFGVGTSANAASAVEAFLAAENMLSSNEISNEHFARLFMALAQCYEYGIGIQKDHVKAIYYYKQAAESGIDEALFRAGRAITQGIGMKAEYAAARPHILRAARRGYAPAMLMIGMFSDDGRGVAQNLDDAKAWYLKVLSSATEPHMSLYDFPERFAENFKLHTESRIRAHYKLGMLIAKQATDISGYIQSFEYIALAASMGYGGAQNEVARIYASGGDLAEYYNSPFFVPDAKFEGSDTMIGKDPLSDAMNKLGDTFFDGKGSLKKNEEAAARCYRYAAELGHAEGAYSYGWCLRHGVGIHENDAEAAKWLKMAADKGNVSAAYSYGLCCEEGSGTGVTNKREAVYYYRLAAGLGHVDAAKRFLKLSRSDE